jgi:hypothetical protein
MSSRVVVGRVIAVGAAQWNTPDGAPPSRDIRHASPLDVMKVARIAVETTARGPVEPDVETVWIAGGTIGCDEFRVSWLPDVRPGQRYVVFLKAVAPRTGQAGVVQAFQLWAITGDSVATSFVGAVPLGELIAQLRADPASSAAP